MLTWKLGIKPLDRASVYVGTLPDCDIVDVSERFVAFKNAEDLVTTKLKFVSVIRGSKRQGHNGADNPKRARSVHDVHRPEWWLVSWIESETTDSHCIGL